MHAQRRGRQSQATDEATPTTPTAVATVVEVRAADEAPPAAADEETEAPAAQADPASQTASRPRTPPPLPPRSLTQALSLHSPTETAWTSPLSQHGVHGGRPSAETRLETLAACAVSTLAAGTISIPTSPRSALTDDCTPPRDAASASASASTSAAPSPTTASASPHASSAGAASPSADSELEEEVALAAEQHGMAATPPDERRGAHPQQSSPSTSRLIPKGLRLPATVAPQALGRIARILRGDGGASSDEDSSADEGEAEEP